MSSEIFDNMSIDDKIRSLLFYYGVKESLIIEDDEDKPMILIALQQPDIESVSIDNEGGLEITYTGNMNE